jgi:methionyl aminopeptidase
MAHHKRVPSVARKSSVEIEIMREAGRIVAKVLAAVQEAAAPGVSTAQLDRLAEEIIEAAGASPSFKGYYGYPASICVEPDDVVVHGIPSETEILSEGQIVGVDVGAIFHGYQADAAVTFGIGRISAAKQRLMDVTVESLAAGIAAARAGNQLRDVSAAVQARAESAGYGVVRDLVGHGIGRSMHEAPQVPNFVEEGQFVEYDLTLRTGHCLAIEPMINQGDWRVRQGSDGWTIRTADGLPTAHFEHTVAVTKDEPLILTVL